MLPHISTVPKSAMVTAPSLLTVFKGYREGQEGLRMLLMIMDRGIIGGMKKDYFGMRKSLML